LFHFVQTALCVMFKDIQEMLIGHSRILGIGLDLACDGGSQENIIERRLMSFTFEKTPRFSLATSLLHAKTAI